MSLNHVDKSAFHRIIVGVDYGTTFSGEFTNNRMIGAAKPDNG